MERDGWNKRYEGSELLWTAEANRILVGEVQTLKHPPGGTAADVACGEGRNSVWLAEQGWQVAGVDFSDVALQKAHQLATQRGVRAEWVEADLRSHHPAPNTYDLVVVLYLHLRGDDRRAIHATWARSLRSEGVMIVLGHDLTNISEGYGGPQDPSILFTPDDVVSDLSGLTALTIERAERVYCPVSTEEGERTAVDALVRAVRV